MNLSLYDAPGEETTTVRYVLYDISAPGGVHDLYYVPHLYF